MLELTVRLIGSLAVVVGLLLILARFGARKFRGNTGALVHVVHRQPLSRTSAVAVVTVGTRVLVLGTTEQQVSVLAELDPDEIDLDVQDFETLTEQAPQAPELVVAAPIHRASHRAEGATVLGTGGPLSGSVLSPQTWRQAYRSVTGAGASRGHARRAS